MALNLLVKPAKFKDAVKRLGGKRAIGRKLSSKDWQKIPAQIRERAFFSANVENMKFLNRAQKMLKDFLSKSRETVTTPDGRRVTALKKASRGDFVYQMAKLAKELGMGDVLPPGMDRERRDIISRIKDIQSEARLRLIFDTQTSQAQAYGYYKQGQDPAILDEFPAQRFIRAEKRKVPRPLHVRNTNVVRRKDDLEFWKRMNSPAIGGLGVPYGPWGFNSGMDVEDVDRDEAIRLGLIQENEQVQPPDETFNKGLKASADVDPEFLNKFLNKLQKGAVTDGDIVQITEQLSSAPAPAPAKKVPEKVVEPEPTVVTPLQTYTKFKNDVLFQIKTEKDYGKENKALVDKMRVYRKELPLLDREIYNRSTGRRPKRKYAALSDADLKQKAEKIRAQWHADAAKYRQNDRAAQKQSERLFNNVIASKKPNTFQPKGFNTKGAPMRPTKAWKKGTEEWNKLTGDIPVTPLNDADIAAGITPESAAKALPASSNIYVNKKKRAFSREGEGIFVSRDEDIRTIIHELGHQLEDNTPWIKNMVKKWMQERLDKGRKALEDKLKKTTDPTKREGIMQKLLKYTMRPLNKIYKTKQYDSWEVAFEDDFLDAYVGKVYERGSTEIVSMGLERMYHNPVQFQRSDPDHFDLMLRILKGVDTLDVNIPIPND